MTFRFAANFLIIIIILFFARGISQKIFISSDSLFLNDFTSNLLYHHGNFKTWALEQAPSYFPDMTLYILIAIFVGSAKTQILIMSLMHLILLYCVASLLLKKFLSYSGSILCAFGITCATAFAQIHSNQWIIFYSTNNHFSDVIFGLLGLTFSLSGKNDKPSRKNWKILLCIFMGTISSITFVYVFVLPLFLTLTTKHKLQQNDKVKVPLWKLVVHEFPLLMCALLAVFSGNLINSNNKSLVSRITPSIPRIINSAHQLSIAFVDATRSTSLTERFSIYAALVCICFLLYRLYKTRKSLFMKISQENLESQLQLFWVISLITTLSATILSGGMVDRYCFRYFMFNVILTAVLIILRLSEVLKKGPVRGTKVIFITGVLLLSFIPAINADYLGYPSKEIASCINHLESEGVPLRNGVADYWFARSVNYYLKAPDKILSVYNDLSPFYWMTTSEYLTSPSKYSVSTYNFIIIHKDRYPDPFMFTTSALIPTVPKPTAVYSCVQNTMEIWYYYNDKLNDVMKSRRAEFVDKLNAD